MAQIQSQYDETRVPFSKMTFSPDVPSTALGPTEYNDGINVETDVRGIRSMAGDQSILDTVPGTPTYVTGGYRQGDEFWFIVATTEGYWWASNGGAWQDITPGGTPFAGYTQATNITEAWNGTVPIFNDSLNPPMFLPDEPGAILAQYSNLIPQVTVYDIAYAGPTTQTITVGAVATSCTITGTTLTIGGSVAAPGVIATGQYVTGTGVTAGTKIVSGSGTTWTVNSSQTVASTTMTFSPYTAVPYTAGQKILISGINNYYNGTYTVVSSTLTTITYTAVPGAGFPSGSSGTVSPAYTWNYNPNWKGYYANFLRIYSTPNVGSILIAGNLTATLLDDTEVKYPVTVQWSQAFGLNQAPITWEPTVTNVANQLEVPLRGPALDGFPCNGQFFLCSYWDTVVFSPINYTTTSAPILGVRLFNQGRGLLSSNCWANTDKMVYGVDARDIWVFDGNDFQGLGNQRVKNWFYDQLDPAYVDRVFMEVNSQRNQIEIYYPTTEAINGVPNKMLSYRYDLDCWNAPRDVSSATMACESPIWGEVGGVWTFNYGSRTVVYARGETDVSIVQKDQGYKFIETDANPNGDIESVFRRDNIKLLPNYTGKMMVHRILPEVVNMGDNELPVYPSTGNITVQIDGADSVGSEPTAKTAVAMPIATDNPWAQIDQNAFRVNSIELRNTSNADIWMCSATTWQYTQVEDDR